MRFLYPQYFQLLLLLAVLLPFWLYQVITKHRTRLSLGDSRPLRRISRLSSLAQDCGRYLLLNLVLALLILAVAHPQWIRETRVPHPKKMDIIFLLDTSPSMRAEDIHPSRLERALEVIGNFSRSKLSHDRIALVSFAGGSLVLSYLTEDPDNILYYLNYLKDETALSFGTNIGRALKNGLTVIAKDLEVNSSALDHKRVFILISDGEDHGQELESAMRELKGLAIKVHTIGIGSSDGAPIPIAWEDGRIKYLEDQYGNRVLSRFDENTLRWIAEETGGTAYRAFSGQELKNIFAEVALREREIDSFKKGIEFEDSYRTFLFAAFGILLASILI